VTHTYSFAHANRLFKASKQDRRQNKTILQIKVLEVILSICKYIFIVCRGWDVPASPTAVAHRNNDGLYVMVL